MFICLYDGSFIIIIIFLHQGVTGMQHTLVYSMFVYN